MHRGCVCRAAIIALGDRGVVRMADILVQDSQNGFGMRESSDEFKAKVKAQLLSTDEFATRLYAGAAAAGMTTSVGGFVGNALWWTAKTLGPYVVMLSLGWIIGARSTRGGKALAPSRQ
eukprot:COSAG02_NODE_4904_length_4848_cov_23.116867_4_plen_119_part_00